MCVSIETTRSIMFENTCHTSIGTRCCTSCTHGMLSVWQGAEVVVLAGPDPNEPASKLRGVGELAVDDISEVRGGELLAVFEDDTPGMVCTEAEKH